jgi:hypothetical protein
LTYDLHHRTGSSGGVIGRGHRTGGHRIKSAVYFDLRLISTAGGRRAAGDLCLLLTKSINKVFTKIKAKFTESEQQLFVASFYGFLKYDPNNDFVIDKHYKKSLYQPGKQSDHTRGGQKLCLKAWTKKADSIQHGKILSKSKSIDGIINNKLVPLSNSTFRTLPFTLI